MKPKPPHLADKLFEWYCDRAAVEDLHGDMEELFYHNLTRMPARKAKLKYWQQVLSLMLSYAIKKRKKDSAYPPEFYSPNNVAMVTHYLKIGFRNLKRNKGFSIINILGLSLGISSCVLLLFFVQDELSFEQHFKDSERIYRLVSTMRSPDGKEFTIPRSSPPVGPTMLNELPEIESVTRVVKDLSVEEEILKYNDKSFYEKRGYQVDSNFFNMFPYEFVEGNPQKALQSPAAIVLSEAVAKKIFGNKSALDELIRVPTYRTDTLRVTGVIKQNKFKSHLDADFYMSGLEKVLEARTSWAVDNFVFTYLKLKTETQVESVVRKLPALIDRHGEKENREMGRKKILSLQSLTDVHLHSRHFSDTIELGTRGSETYIYLTSAIALLILTLACINFINLSTAKGSQRAREIGIRKTIGAYRLNLIPQFIGESIGLAFIAMVVSCAIISFALPFFNELVQKDFALTSQNIQYIGGALLAISLLTGIIAGIYPALVLSSFDPVSVLKNNVARSFSFNSMRQGLIIFQFSITIILISAILIIRTQLGYLQGKPLGFDSAYKVLIPLRTSESTDHYLEFKNVVKSIAGVTEVTASSNLPSTPATSDWNFYPASKGSEDPVPHYIIFVDEDYFKTMSIPIIAGRDFSYPSDIPAADAVDATPQKVIINRSSMKKFGIDLTSAQGSRILSSKQNNHFEVVGVVEDFNQYSLHQPISPLMFYTTPNPSSFKYALIAVTPQDYLTTISKINDAWVKLIPDTPFESELLTESLQRQYEADSHVSTVISSATVLAIIISCLGLYGLSIFVAQRKVKEIGIRKVLGAGIQNIIAILAKEFFKIILISFLIGVPISYFITNEWLKTFAYRAEPELLTFLLAGIIGCLIAVLSIGYETIKASLINPVNTLKAE